MKNSTFWVYILHCENNAYYTGYTTDIQKRYQSHLNGTGKCKYTRSFKPLKIAQTWEIEGDKVLAMRIETYIKKLSRKEKEKIIKNPCLISEKFMNIFKKLTTLEYEAADFGFKWENAGQIMVQIRSELTEIEVHLKNPLDNSKLQEEIGDLLHAAFSLCVFQQLDPNETLQKSIDKFERRFKETKQLAQSEGLKDLNGQSFETLMTFWDKAKQRVG